MSNRRNHPLLKRIGTKVTSRDFRPGARRAALVLCESQTGVMLSLWREPPGFAVNEVEERLRGERDIAHTTVLTTLDRVQANGYRPGEKLSKAFVCPPRPGTCAGTYGRGATHLALYSTMG